MKRNNGRGAARTTSLQAVARKNRSIYTMVAAMLGMTSDEGILAKTSSQLSGRSVAKAVPTWRKFGHKPHQGEAERANRRDQIDKCLLNKANGFIRNHNVIGNKVCTNI